MAASSLSWMARLESVCAAWVAAGPGIGVGVVVEELREGRGGRRRRTSRSFMWGTAEVATARRVGSVGHSATEEGEKAIQALEWGARFCRPRSWSEVGVD